MIFRVDRIETVSRDDLWMESDFQFMLCSIISLYSGTSEWRNPQFERLSSSQWLNSPLTQWLNSFLSQWLNSPLSQWLNSPLSQWLNCPLSDLSG